MLPARDDSARRSVVPTAAGRSLWRAAVWTGVGAAAVDATLAIVAVAVCWLPVSGSPGRIHSAIHAGVLTFLAALHGGVTVDATAASFLPLGLLLAVGLTAWRAGAGLADVAAAIGEQDPVRLALAGLAQAASFATVCLIAVPFATLGTSSVPFLGVGAAALVLFAVFGGGALAAYSPLSDRCLERVPPAVRRGVRVAAAVLAVYVAAGALLVAAALLVQHGRVEELSRHVGSGWGGVPILILDGLAMPNAVIAAVGYLAGPGFAVGVATSVSPASTAHGTLPAFPILGAVPSGHGADSAAWLLIVLTPLVAGLVFARLVRRAEGWGPRWRSAATALAVLALALVVLGWQGGGGIGDAGLRVVGASPWRLGLAVAAAVGAVGGGLLGLAELGRWLTRSLRMAAESNVAPRTASARAPDPAADQPVSASSATQRLVALSRLTRSRGAGRPDDGAHPDDNAAGGTELAG